MGDGASARTGCRGWGTNPDQGYTVGLPKLCALQGDEEGAHDSYRQS